MLMAKMASRTTMMARAALSAIVAISRETVAFSTLEQTISS